jgi:hypothetical protein
MRERLANCEETAKRASLAERGFAEMAERMRNREEGRERQVSGQLQAMETSLRKAITEEVSLLRNTLDLSKKESCLLNERIKRL